MFMKLTVEPVYEDLMHRLEGAAHRYASYPTADRFVEAFSAEDYTQALKLRSIGAAATAQPFSIYVHIPFCKSLCYFCACNKTITRHHDRATSYLQYLSREVDLHTRHLGFSQPVTQLHLGGGTPTFLSDPALREFMQVLRNNFSFASKGEYTIEVDPRTIDTTRLATLIELGFNCLSLGIQDFDPVVQKAIHRVQPYAQVVSLVAAARQLGFGAINIDLMVGLPRQSTESFEHTLAQVIELRPQRISVYAYAHLPDRFKPQRKIAAAELPNGAAKAAMMSRSVAAFIGAGYVHLGMHHFALPTDSLAIAKRQGRLHRNLQGYSTQPDGDSIGLGVSAIGRMGATYSQNSKTLAEYFDHIDQGLFPVVQGLGLSRDDLVRRAVIMSLMCQGEVLFESIELAHLLVFKKYFAPELEELETLIDQGLVTRDDSGIQVTSTGSLCVHTVAMVFDRYLQADRMRARFSRII
jgi:oxygen-independent coproporphyrinogen-3 oxidase